MPPPPHATAVHVLQDEYEAATAGVDEAQLADFAAARAELGDTRGRRVLSQPS
eukprot:SAG31_NODE_24564_length_478_cov_67.955145_2_plen_52_part_01